MSYLTQFIGENKKVVLSDRRELSLKPLAVRHIKYILDAKKGGEVNPEAIQNLVMTVLKESYPNASNEDINEFPFNLVSEILPVIFEMHDLPKGVADMAIDEVVARVKEVRESQTTRG